MLVFNDFLAKAGPAPDGVAMMLHTPREPKLSRRLPWIVAQRAELFESNQSCQGKLATATLRKRAHLASFVGPGDVTQVQTRIWRLDTREKGLNRN